MDAPTEKIIEFDAELSLKIDRAQAAIDAAVEACDRMRELLARAWLEKLLQEVEP